jgi:DNA invertase Pin-like site-specific DNA recombinase
MELLAVHDEIDVSGGTPLASREGLRSAVEAVEAGEADVVIVAYFDRLVRSLRVQDEVVSRVEAAGGRVVALDFGQVTGTTAAQWLSGTMIGAVSEYHRRSAGERSGEAQANAVARGVVPWPNIPPGYVRGDDGRLEPDPLTAPAVAEAFRRRAEDGATIAEVRDYLREQGVRRSYHGVQALLGSQVVLGEIHFGKLVNLDAHPAIINRATWERVQGVRVSRGRRAKSDRLLARLGVLRCGTCGARMVVGSSHHGRYPIYRCPPIGDCPRRVAISARKVEAVVVEGARRALAGVVGRASAQSDAREAEAASERAQGDLDAAIRAFAGLEDEVATRERLAELRRARDEARDRADHLRSLHTGLEISVGRDWDRLTLAERRGLIRAVVEQVTVAPGRGADRVTVHLLGE